MAENKMLTDNGKELLIYQVGKTNLYSVKWNKGGTLPKMLQGRFTSKKLAYDACVKFINLDKDSKWKQYKEQEKKKVSVFNA